MLTPAAPPAASQEAARHEPGDLPAGATVLDVPYLPQSELLCGGAAAAMVLRYWGMTGVRAEDFVHLVSEARGGMRADDLAARIRELGREVFPFAGRFEEVRRHVRLGRPVISLIEVPGGFHYVVLVGEAGDRLVLHDPAAVPYRLVDRAELEAAWEATGGLSLLVLPPRGEAPNVRPPAGPPAESAQGAEAPAGARDRSEADVPRLPADCRSRLDRAIAAATAGRLSRADELLDVPACRDHPAVLRELAGVRLLRGRPDDAARLARRALEIAPGDGHAARTLATALYVDGSPEEALRAWNRVGEPTVDLVRIAGLEDVSHRPVARLLGIRGGDRLTVPSLELANRRLADLPAAAMSRVGYVPTGGGRADVVAGLAERSGLPTSPVPLAATALRAAIYREIALTAVSPLGRGETWSGGWRWWERRPAVSFRFAVPAALGPPAIWTLGAGWERETYAPGSAAAPFNGPAEVERTGVSLGSSWWLHPHLRAGLRLGYDRWEGRGGHVRGGLAVDVRAAGDRLRLTGELDRWASLDGRTGFGTLAGRLDAASRTRPDGLVLSGRAYARTAGTNAPPTLWPGAGTGIARPELLRAHPLLDDGAIAGRAFDRHLAGAGGELVRWLAPDAAVRLGPAVFLDAARTWGEREAVWRVDAGVGLRVTTAAGGPTLRIDVATGLSDDEWAVSAGWSSAGSSSPD